MNTHDIELPPLPEARIVSYQTDSTMRCMELRTHSNEDMRDYARAAIEADRKRTTELLKNPVHVHTNMCRGIIAPITFDMLAHVLGEEATQAWLKHRGEPDAVAACHAVRPYIDSIVCYASTMDEHDGNRVAKMVEDVCAAHPQPAEPVKLPSDEERAAQGLPPYNPRLPTDEEMKRLTENGRKAWGKDDTEPVKVLIPVEIKALAEEHLSVEDVPGYGPTVSGEGEFARALLARYGNAAPFQVDHELVSKWQQANGITKDPAEPSKQSEVREYFQQTLRTAADEACRLIANSDTPTKFEGIFGHRAEQLDYASAAKVCRSVGANSFAECFERAAQHKAAKCDGDHGGLSCANPEHWNDSSD